VLDSSLPLKGTNLSVRAMTRNRFRSSGRARNPPDAKATILVCPDKGHVLAPAGHPVILSIHISVAAQPPHESWPSRAAARICIACDASRSGGWLKRLRASFHSLGCRASCGPHHGPFVRTNCQACGTIFPHIPRSSERCCRLATLLDMSKAKGAALRDRKISWGEGAGDTDAGDADDQLSRNSTVEAAPAMSANPDKINSVADAISVVNVPFERRMQTAAVASFVMALPATFVCIFASLLMLLNPLTALLMLAYLCHIFTDTSPHTGRRKSEWVRGLQWWKHFANYFPMSLKAEEELDPGKKYVFGYHPHGIISVGALAAFGTDGLSFSKIFKGIDVHLVTLPTNFKVPFLREVWLSLGICDSSKKTFQKVLSRGSGSAVAVVVGGAAESLQSAPGQIELTLCNRRGFVRQALLYGASVVPTVAFGCVPLPSCLPPSPELALSTPPSPVPSFPAPWLPPHPNTLPVSSAPGVDARGRVTAGGRGRETDVFETTQSASIKALQEKAQKAMGFAIPIFHGRGIFQKVMGLREACKRFSSHGVRRIRADGQIRGEPPAAEGVTPNLKTKSPRGPSRGRSGAASAGAARRPSAPPPPHGRRRRRLGHDGDGSPPATPRLLGSAGH